MISNFISVHLKSCWFPVVLKWSSIRRDICLFIECLYSLSGKNLQLEKEVKELTKQRNLAQSRVEDLLQMLKSDKTSSQKVCIK